MRGDAIHCGYHGLAFGANSACVVNPHGPIVSALQVRAFPVVERHDAMWIWMGDRERADAGAIPDLSFIDAVPAPARVKGYLRTRAHTNSGTKRPGNDRTHEKGAHKSLG